jgi:hypothetical protein
MAPSDAGEWNSNVIGAANKIFRSRGGCIQWPLRFRLVPLFRQPPGTSPPRAATKEASEYATRGDYRNTCLVNATTSMSLLDFFHDDNHNWSIPQGVEMGEHHTRRWQDQCMPNRERVRGSARNFGYSRPANFKLCSVGSRLVAWLVDLVVNRRCICPFDASSCLQPSHTKPPDRRFDCEYRQSTVPVKEVYSRIRYPCGCYLARHMFVEHDTCRIIAKRDHALLMHGGWDEGLFY